MKLPHQVLHDLDDAQRNFEQLQSTGSGILPTGAISMYAGQAAPTGYLLCDGAQYPASAYPALFATIGYTYGGAGANFRVPDLRGRAPIGAGTGTAAGATAHALGAQPTTGAGGEETHLLSTAEMPSHTHPPGSGTFFLESNNAGAGTAAPGASFSLTSIHAATGTSGGGGAHNIMQPTTALNFLIKT